MQKTVSEILEAAAREIGVMGRGLPLEDDDAELMLEVLQGMHDSQEADTFKLFKVTRRPIALVANQQNYTVGVGLNFSITQAPPTNIGQIEAFTIIPSGQTFETEVTPFRTREDWLLEPWKSLTSTYPWKFWYEPGETSGTVSVWPIPTTAPSGYLSLYDRLTSPADLTTVIGLPPLYYEMWKLTLAEKCQRVFRKPYDKQLALDAENARLAVDAMNDPGPPPARFDGILPTSTSGRFDIYSNRNRP